jgi:hypothetical protein
MCVTSCVLFTIVSPLAGSVGVSLCVEKNN